MKETTKPNTSHLLKRDLAVNIAVLPLPTPPAGARGEGWGSRAETVESEPSSAETMDLQFPRFMDIAARRDEPLSLSPFSEQILTLTTDRRLPNV
jgi:hypothetical protein